MFKLCLAITAISMCVFAGTVSGTIINVPADQITVQLGVNASTSGDTVLVHPGFYSEDVVIDNKNITLASLYLTTGIESYISSTTISSPMLQRALELQNGTDTTCYICGLTLSSSYHGVYLNSASSCKIRKCHFSSDNFAIGCNYSSVIKVSNCSFSGCPHGITFGINNTAYIDSCQFFNCSYEAVYLECDICRAYITNSYFYGNTTAVAVYSEITSTTIDNCEFVNNGTAIWGMVTVTNSTIQDGGRGIGGMGSGYGYSYTAYNCTFENLTDTVITSAATSDINSCTIRNNTGPIASVGSDRRLSFNDCMIYGNTGAGIRAAGSMFTILFVDSCLYTDNSEPITYNSSMDGYCSITNSTVADNDSTGVYISTNTSDINIANSIISDNGCKGIYCSGTIGGLYIGCCDVYGNDEGNYSGISDQTGSNGNISLNPMFCYADTGNYYIYDASPCAPANNSCGVLMGRYPVNCIFSNRIWYVSTGGSDITGDGTESNPYATIQRAIDMSFDGDTVMVTPGIYTGVGNREITTDSKAILVTSQEGASTTIINVQDLAFNGFSLEYSYEDSTTIIEGFTIKNAQTGILLTMAAPILRNLIFDSNDVTGIGILMPPDDHSICNCDFTNNPDGLTYIASSGYLTSIEDCDFYDNTGGGIYIDERNVSMLVKRCSFSTNYYGVNAYSVNSESTCIFDSCTFWGNQWAMVGGFTLRNSNVSYGVNGISGSVEYSGYQNVVTDCVFEHMTGTVFHGSGLNGYIINSIIRDNSDEVAEYHSEKRHWFKNCWIYGNAGGITATGWDTRLYMDSCLYFDNGKSITYAGTEYGGLSMNYCTVYDNSSTGVQATSVVNTPISIRNCIIAGNDSCGFLFSGVTGNLDFSYCDVYDNAVANYCSISDQTGANGNISCDPMFCDPSIYDLSLSDSSCCVGAGESGTNIGALGIGCGLDYLYLPGDCNMYAGSWPPVVIGSDVTYLVGYFRGASPSCLLDGFYAAADVNGDCMVIASDVTYLVNYFRGMNSINYCADYPPAWSTPDDVPNDEPSGWPDCE